MDADNDAQDHKQLHFTDARLSRHVFPPFERTTEDELNVFRSIRSVSAETHKPGILTRTGMTTGLALTLFLCCGATGPQACQPVHIGLTAGEKAGIGVVAGAAVATVVLVEIHQSHHNLKGCVFGGPNGLELQTSDLKTYSLDGAASNVKAGDLVRLHGSRISKAKNGDGKDVFRVEELKKDYGACRITPGAAANLTKPPDSSHRD